MKKRILWVNEASFMNTGFSVQSMECLKRLYALDKYEIAELGSYVEDNTPQAVEVPWKFYGAIPTTEGTIAHKRYHSSNEGQFGAAVYEDVLIDFKPDIVIHARDEWMCNFENDSPFRKYYKSIWIPTIDGEPQRTKWLDSYRSPDLLMTHSRYAKNLLARQSPDIKVFDMANPGVDHELYKPMSQQTCRNILGLPKDANIILTVMRNQKRKLYPDLLEMFKKYLDYCIKMGDVDKAKNTYLHLHTSYPDVGYDIARLIMQHKLSHKVYVTYYCRACRKFYADHFQTEMTVCKHCGELAAIMPNTQYGLTRDELPYIYNCADLYIQYAIAEGLGMPLVEAKSCGIPVFTIDDSAMSEHGECLGSWKIKVQRRFSETVLETEQNRALPDIEDTYKKLYMFFDNYTKEQRAQWSSILRQDAIDHFSFDRSAKIIEKAIDSLEVYDANATWNNPKADILNPKLNIPDSASHGDFINYLINDVIKRPDKLNTEWRNELVKALNVGYLQYKGQRMQFNRDAAIDMFKDMVMAQNFWEQSRVKRLQKKEKVIEWSLV